MQLLRGNPALQVQLPFPGDAVEGLPDQGVHSKCLPTSSVAIDPGGRSVAQLFFESERESRAPPIFNQLMTHPLDLGLIPLDRAVATEAEAMFKFFR